MDARAARPAAPGLGAVVRAVARRAGRRVLVPGRRTHLRRRLALALVALVLLGAGGLMLRDSALLAVRHVRVSGVRGPDAALIEGALQRAASHQSTLHLNVAALRAAVAPFGLVRDLHVSVSLPHTLRIAVAERLPAATLVAGGAQAVVAGDGTVLPHSVPATGTPPLPVLALPTGPRVTEVPVLEQLTVLGAAPQSLLRRVARVSRSADGLDVVMNNGLLIIFGDATLAGAKWVSAARVMADPSSLGATYLDVRLPDRPAAGGMPQGSTTPASGGVSPVTSAAVAGADTQAALAASLAAAVSGASVTPAPGAAVPGPVTTPGATAPTAAAAIPGAASPTSSTRSGPRPAAAGAPAGGAPSGQGP